MKNDNSMVEIKELARVGDNINYCIEKVLQRLGTMVPEYMSAKGAYFDFNGNRVNVFKDDTVKDAYRRWQGENDARAEAYRKSPEGIAAEQRNVEAMENSRNNFVAAYSANPDFTNYAAVVEWIGAWERYATIHTFDGQKAAFVLQRLVDAGYKSDAHCMSDGLSDDDQKVYSLELMKDRRRCGEYLIGQAMSCLGMGMPPHPVYGSFLERWRTIPSAKEE